MSSQFADLFEKVDGSNSYEMLLDLALGRRPRPKRRRGAHRFAASCVMRCFEDRLVRRVPAEAELRALARGDERVEVLAEAGIRLSQQMQDDCSFRSGLANIGGGSREEVLGRFAQLRRSLRFEFTARSRNSRHFAGWSSVTV